MELQQALEIVRAAGYRVASPRVKNPVRVALLNAIGKPFAPQYDPNYRMKYKPRKYAPGGGEVGAGISPERWDQMCVEAASNWAAFMAE